MLTFSVNVLLVYAIKVCTFNLGSINCDYVLFTKLSRSGDSEGTFRSSIQAATSVSNLGQNFKTRVSDT